MPGGQIQAMYRLPSLGVNVDLVITYMEFQAKQPKELPHHGGERGKLLDSFCLYQKKKNPKKDDNPKHWDIALYISGLDFFVRDSSGKMSNGTMGESSPTADRVNLIFLHNGNVFGLLESS